MSNIEQALKNIDAILDLHSNGNLTPKIPHLAIEVLNQCKSALAEIEKCEPVAKLGRWKIDKSTGTEILTLDNCSVIEGKYAHYIMGLLQKEIDKVVGELENTSPISKECEPVAWVLDHTPNKGYMKVTHVKAYADKEMSRTKESNPSGFGKEYGCYPYDVCIPLCRCDTSPISKEWVGLSDQQIQNLIINSDNYNKFQFIKSVEHTVKQINASEKG